MASTKGLDKTLGNFFWCHSYMDVCAVEDVWDIDEDVGGNVNIGPSPLSGLVSLCLPGPDWINTLIQLLFTSFGKDTHTYGAPNVYAHTHTHTHTHTHRNTAHSSCINHTCKHAYFFKLNLLKISQNIKKYFTYTWITNLTSEDKYICLNKMLQSTCC